MAYLNGKEILFGPNLIKVGDYNQGFEDGKSSVKNPLEMASGLIQTFYGVTFPTDYELKLNVPNTTSINSCFNGSLNLKKLIIEGNVNNNPIDLHRMVYGGSRATLEEIDFSNFNLNVETLNQAFNNCVSLKRILGMFDLTNTTSVNNSFGNCLVLEEVRFKGNSIFLSISFSSSSTLSDESIQSIIDGLADLTGQTAQTLTVHKTVGEKLTDTQKATITAKNWTLAY